MKNKIVWLLVSGLMVATLVLASCGPAVTEEEEEEEEVVTEEEEVAEEEEEEEEEEGPEMVRDSLGKLVEKPKYGGVYTGLGGNQLYFDDVFGYTQGLLNLTNEQLLMGDWSKGPAGTGDTNWYYRVTPPEHLMAGCLAESWERPDDQTLIFHIRKGVHWHNSPPTNGRVVTADDVVFSLTRSFKAPTSHPGSIYPWDTYIESITAPDDWTVIVKTQPGRQGAVYEMSTGFIKIFPRDAVEEFGDLGDWENSVGTGPFILVDYVRDSSATLESNPGYWMNDPLHPENTLPYVDGLKLLIIPDTSTRMAAMRTGKLDHMTLGWEQADELLSTAPQLRYKKGLALTVPAIHMRVDMPELPTYDVRVRQALAMAVNNQEIADEFYGGNAVIFAWPVAPVAEWSDMFVPLEELSQPIREQFEYNPDKAKQLLAEAGYPDGFAAEVMATTPTWAVSFDMLSIIKDYWAKIGVDLTIDVREYGAFHGMRRNWDHKDMTVEGLYSYLAHKMVAVIPTSHNNQSRVNDPVINEALEQITAAYFDWDRKVQLIKEITPYILEQTLVIHLPEPYTYTIWQPWVKNYQGEATVGYFATNGNFVNFIWLDQDLKEEMTGGR